MLDLFSAQLSDNDLEVFWINFFFTKAAYINISEVFLILLCHYIILFSILAIKLRFCSNFVTSFTDQSTLS